jgi:hypothetical protein
LERRLSFSDGGENWTYLGLNESERIVKILVNPKDSNNVYVCVTGKLWSDSDERGVYRTKDGGKSWTRVLRGRNASTGCSMLSMDKQDPETLYAGLWDFRRKGWTFRSGGENETAPSGSGLFKSKDGGETWTQLDEKNTKGLPPKTWGRVAVTSAPSKPKNGLRVYRSRRAERRTLSLGRRRRKLGRARPQPHDDLATVLFANLIVDPKNENRIYSRI